MLRDRIEAKWIDAFAHVFELCKVQRGEACAILSETQSRPLNVHLAELALARLGAVVFRVVVPSKPQDAPVPVRSTGASNALAGQRAAIEGLKAAGLVVDLTVEGLLHARELPEVLSGGARLLMISNEHPDALERLAPDPAMEARVSVRPAGVGTGARAVATGSMAVPTGLIEAFHARSVPVIQIYGSTETAPVAVYQRIREAYDSVGSMGRVGLHTEVRVVDANDAEVGPGVPGEVLVRGEHVAGGYWNDPEATAKALAGNRFRSGDIAEDDTEGRFWFKDRIRNVIISGGENIYPAEIQRALHGLPGVRECQVVGRPDARWGMVPVAIVVADAGLTREAVLRHFYSRLARFKHPRDVVFLDELPRNAMGKVRLDELARIVQGSDAAGPPPGQ